MRKEIYDSLFNKSFKDMTIEDYKIYHEICTYRNRKKAYLSSTLIGLIAPWPIIGGIFGIAGLFLKLWFVPLITSCLFGFCNGVLMNPNNSYEYRRAKTFYKTEFTKEDLKLMKKEKIFEKISKFHDEFEITDTFRHFEESLKMTKEEILPTNCFEDESEIRKKNISGTYLNKQIAEQKMKETNVEIENVDEDTKGL